jgi:hypothetical protein
MPICRNFSENFPRSWIVATRLLQMDGPPTFRISRFATPDDTKKLCQLETPVAEMPTVSSMSATCPNEWTTVIFSGFRDFRRGVSRPFVNKTSDIPNSEVLKMMALGSAATCPLRWTTHNLFGISRYVMSGFRVSEFWRAVSFAHPTPDPRFCDGIRSTTHDLSQSNGPE